MTRIDFIKRVVQVGLFAALGFLVFGLKNRIVTGPVCTSCPEIGSCRGKSECRKF